MTQSFDYNENHFQSFKSSTHKWGGWSGTNPLNWYTWIIENSSVSQILPSTQLIADKRLSRQDLFNICQNKEIETIICAISILAWGGMNRKHGAMLLSSDLKWIGLAEKIRNGELSRADAYHNFSQLRLKGSLPGIGPAYFTKLIFFLMPNGSRRGYIMDQWTSASVNLISSTNLVKTKIQISKPKGKSIKYHETVLDSNTKTNYEVFCKFIESLADKLNLSPENAEEMMFSEGRGRGCWRSHVIKNRYTTSNL